jgi:predicted GTPase
MPYGDLARQRVQRFATLDDLARAGCTIEEREEYEPHLANGTIVYAGDDYAAILRAAEAEADVIVWDGGNNDFAFFRPDLTITVTDPHRAGDELRYYPGATNLRLADVVVINKVDTATAERLETLRQNIARVNPRATVIEAASPPIVGEPEHIVGKRVLVIEDGPSVTHGGMPFGIGMTAARQYGAAEIVDPRPYAVGSLREVYATYPQLGPLLPAMGYGERQVQELAQTIARVPCDSVVVGTPIDLRRLIPIPLPSVRVGYDLVEQTKPDLADLLAPVVALANR